MKRVILTNMCLLYKKDRLLVQIREKGDWPGLTLPGGHLEAGENEIEACKREVLEETGLEVTNLEEVGEFIWDWDEIHRAKLFRTSSFNGNLRSSAEGKMLWLKADELTNYPWSNDFDKILKILAKGLSFEEKIRYPKD